MLRSSTEEVGEVYIVFFFCYLILLLHDTGNTQVNTVLFNPLHLSDTLLLYRFWFISKYNQQINHDVILLKLLSTTQTAAIHINKYSHHWCEMSHSAQSTFTFGILSLFWCQHFSHFTYWYHSSQTAPLRSHLVTEGAHVFSLCSSHLQRSDDPVFFWTRS